MKDTKAAYIWLNSIEGLGCVKQRQLLNNIGTIEILWNATINDLIQMGLSKDLARRIVNTRNKEFYQNKLDNIISNGTNVICIEEKIYPQLLKQIYDPPIILYAKGNLSILSDDILWIAMVGTRRPSAYGQMMAKNISSDLSKKGIGIISGMAKGIDGICHQMTISNGVKTIGVLGNGCDIIYPKSNAKLYSDIVDKGGLLISEFEPNQMPLKHHFPRRNRIISGLSHGVVVIEAGKKSGSLITAKYALEQDRIVMCVPENVNLSKARGSFNLLRQGAIPISNAQDICDELNYISSFKNICLHNEQKKYDTTLEKTLAMIEPATASQIAYELDIDVSEVLLQLTYLELKGKINRNRGGVYILNS